MNQTHFSLRERSAMILSRVEQNDPGLERLSLGISYCPGDYYWPNDRVELSRLGDAIGRNTHLKKLLINSPCVDDVNMFVDNRTFFEGLKRNSSIDDLDLKRLDLSEGAGHEILNEYLLDNINIKTISLCGCDLGNRGIGVLTSAITKCPNLKATVVVECNIDDGSMLEELISGISGLNQLRSVGLFSNNFGRAGCEALATLLQDPNCNLLNLSIGGIDDNCATVFTNSLIGNSTLKSLVFVNQAVTESGFDAFSAVLCDTSSINATYCSNHTLHSIIQVQGGAHLPTNLRSLLELNTHRNKEQVAVKKILRYHSYLDMEPFLEWDLKVLPLAFSWFDKARRWFDTDERSSQNESDEINVGARKLSAIYQFARAVPMMFVPYPKIASTKRKIDQVSW